MAAWKRNIITRLVAIIPSVIIALVFGESGSDELIVLTQVFIHHACIQLTTDVSLMLIDLLGHSCHSIAILFRANDENYIK